jgi:hypothetical protein
MRHLMATVIMNILPRSCFVRPSLMIGRHDPPRSGFVVTNCTSLCYLEFHFIRLSLLHPYTFIVYIRLLSTIVYVILPLLEPHFRRVTLSFFLVY